MERLLEDIRQGARSLRRSYRFALAAVLTLALGIGVNTAMFTVIHAVVLESWPVEDPARVLVVFERQADGNNNLFSTPAFLDWKQQGGLLAHMGAHVQWQFNLSSPGEAPERIAGGQVSSDLLPVLGVEPMLGRLFSPAEDTPGAGNTVILSYPLWKNRYGGDTRIVGRPVQLNGSSFTVLGVMPRGFDFFGGKELLWTPLGLSPNNGAGASPNVHWLLGLIRLPAHLTQAQARAELDGIAAHLGHDNPTSDLATGVFVQSIDDAFTGNIRGPLWMLMGCVGFVLLIACTNVANLLLARGAAQRLELAVRVALGASPQRIVRQLLTESLLLALAGGGLGIAVALASLRGLVALDPPSVPRIDHIAIDGPVLVFSLAVSLGIGVLFGLVPALDAARLDPNSGLRERQSTGSRSLGRQRTTLIIIETALASVLLIGTGLALESLWSLRNIELGFVPDQVQTFRIAAPSHFTGNAVTEFYREVGERIQALPGVLSVSVARNLPMSGGDPSMPITIDGRNPSPVQGETVTRYRAIGEDYFRTLRIPVLAGRAFNGHDSASAPNVAIVSQSLARKYWPGESPVGRRLKPNYKDSAWSTVVGVAADVRHWGLDVDIEPTAYYPYTQIPDSIRPLLEANMSFAVRSTLGQADLMRSIRAAVAGIDPNVPLYGVEALSQMVSDAGSLRRFDLTLLGAFSLLALSLAAIGVYGVIAFAVSQRTREIGVRMALGANAHDVLKMILGQGLRLALMGVVLGVLASILLRKIAGNLIYGLSSTDPIVLSAVPVLMLLVVFAACLVPARRAAVVNPVTALRAE